MSTNGRLLLQIRRNKDFDNHEIVREGPGLWYCGQQDTGNMSFRVISAPGMLMLYGDIGEIIFLPNDRNALRWAYGNTFRADYPYYPMTKLSSQMREMEFLPELVEEWLKCDVREHRKHGDKEDVTRSISMLRDWRDHSYDNDHEAETAYYELCSKHAVDDPPSCRDYPAHTYWCFQAMCWFMTHVNDEDARFAEELRP